MSISVSILDELKASSAENRPSSTGRDDLMQAHDLKGLYNMATKPPLACPYQAVKHAVDKRLFAGDSWSLASVAEWPDHEYEWQLVDPSHVRDSLKLPFTTRASGDFLLSAGDRGIFISGTIDHFNSNEEGPSGVAIGGGKAPVKIKLKIGGAKRPRDEEEGDQDRDGVRREGRHQGK